MSVFAKIAAAKAGTDAEKTFSKAMQQYLQQQLLQKQALERLLAQQKFQREIEQMRESDAWRRMLAGQKFQREQSLLNATTQFLGSAAQSGYIPMDIAAQITDKLQAGELSPSEAYAMAFDAAAKAFANKTNQDKLNAMTNKLLELSPKAKPEDLRAAAQILLSGEPDAPVKAAQILGVSVSAVANAQREVDNAVKMAQSEYYKAGAKLQSARAEEVTKLLDARLNKLVADGKLSEARAEQIRQAIDYDNLANPIRLELLKKKSEYQDLLIERGKALLAQDWKRVKLLDKQIAQIEWETAKSKEDFKFAIPVKVIDAVKAFAAESYDAALEFINSESKTLDEYNVDKDMLKRIAKSVYESNKYKMPKLMAALSAVQMQLNAPPKDPKEDESVLKNVEQRLLEAGLSKDEAKQAIDTLKGAWNVLRTQMDQNERRLALQEANAKLNRLVNDLKGNPDILKEARNWFNLQRQILDDQRQLINTAITATGCALGIGTPLSIEVLSNSTLPGEDTSETCQKRLAPIKEEIKNLQRKYATLTQIAEYWGISLSGYKPAERPDNTNDALANWIMNYVKQVHEGTMQKMPIAQLQSIWRGFNPSGDQEQWNQFLNSLREQGYLGFFEGAQ